ncbi:hypothetical protein [Nocardia sienata]|uniref:hypothetical protein n=1 Tax=Nocardia sienata TaxID=248552 RepID=UPI0007A3BD71|nr:hypothetical protein [Nocardia sienata]
MEYLLSAVAHARIDIPPAVLQWTLATATPMLRSWTQLLGRSDVTDEQAWALLWRDGKLERSAEKVPAGSKDYWTSNATSERLADHVASYLARPNVPPGTVGRVRERFDGAVLTRLDLLRQVTRLGGSNIVCHELAAEPPVGSSRGHQLGARELALVDRYRRNARNEERKRTETITTQVSTILAEDDLLARVERARSQSAFGIEILEACLFGLGSVAPHPETADAASAEWLEEVSSNVMAYSPDSFRMGRIVSALRPIVRMHRDPADRSAQRWWPRRIRDFGPAGVVPLTFSILSEEGEYIIRKLGNDARRYEDLAVLAKEQPNTPLGELCRATDRLTRASEAGHTHGAGDVGHMQQEPERPRSWLPDLDAIRDAWPEISAEVYERRRTTHVMLSGAAVHHVDGHRVVLAHTSASLAKRLSDPRFSTPIVDAIQAVFGFDMEVSCVHVP